MRRTVTLWCAVRPSAVAIALPSETRRAPLDSRTSVLRKYTVRGLHGNVSVRRQQRRSAHSLPLVGLRRLVAVGRRRRRSALVAHIGSSRRRRIITGADGQCCASVKLRNTRAAAHASASESGVHVNSSTSNALSFGKSVLFTTKSDLLNCSS